MEINVFSYLDAEKQFVENPKYQKNWISIRDIGYERIYEPMDKYCKNILILQFDDITQYNIKHGLIHPFYKREMKKRELIYFNENIARQIIKFTNSVYRKNESLNIHCWAGKSRSQAIGFCLNQYYNMFCENNEEDYISNLTNSIGNFNGNYDVVRILTKEIYCIGDYIVQE